MKACVIDVINVIIFQRKKYLKKHIESKDEGLCYKCDQCEFISKGKYIIKTYIKITHEHKGMSIDCDQCSFKTNYRRNLKLHIQTIYDGICYNCDKCSFKTVHTRSLKRHNDVEHEGIRYTSEYCSYKSVEKRSLQNLCNLCTKLFATSAINVISKQEQKKLLKII